MRGAAQGKKHETRTLYIIGDDGCDKSPIFDLLELEQEELNHEINVYVKVLPPDPNKPDSSESIELYDFPTDRVIRPAMALYLRLLPAASCILYFMKEGASERDICQWVRVLHDCSVGARVVFLSDVTTYLQREKILTRLVREFQAVLDSTFFLKLEPYAFRTAFDRLHQLGVNINTANCLKPTFPRKVLRSI